MRRGQRVFLAVALAATACAGPGSDADDVTPSAAPTLRPDGVAVWQHTVLPLGARGADRIELVRDLVIGNQPGEVEGGFYRPQVLAIDDRGMLYVADVGDQNVRAIGPDGRQDHVLGGPGQGPGEFGSPSHIAIAGSRVVVNDRRSGKLSEWDPDGNHVVDHHHGRRFDPGVLAGLPDGTLLALYPEVDGYAVPPNVAPGASGLFRNVVARFSTTGEELSRWAVFPKYGLTLMQPGGDVSAQSAAAYNEGWLDGDGGRLFAVDREGRAYFIETDEYRVRATGTDGKTRWELSAPFERPPYPIEEIDRRAARLSRSRSERRGQTVTIERSNFAWDEYLPALSAVQVDGHGHLWVFPTVPLALPTSDDAPVNPPETTPVDVYSAQGVLLYSGEAANVPWSVAHRDWVYEIERGPETDPVVVRYRLVEPF